MRLATYNPRTQEGLDLHTRCVQVARDTGRIIFGQLWVRDPTIDDVLVAVYSPSIAKALNEPTPLLAFFS